MIVKRQLNPVKVAPYVWKELLFAGLLAAGVYAAYIGAGLTRLALPFTIMLLLGTALAIFLALRVNSANARWAEAAQAWYAIQAASRIFARLIVTFTEAHRHTPQYDAEAAATFRHGMVHRQIAWLHALRLQLRGQPIADEIRPFLSSEEQAEVVAAPNPATQLQVRAGRQIYDAMASGVLQGFDSFQLEGQLAQLAVLQASCERLKAIPVPRQYDVFTRVFVYLFLTLLPFCLIGTLPGLEWMVVPLALVIAFLYVTVERVGDVIELPFENTINDVPLSAIATTAERDLRTMLDEGLANLPARPEPVAGYLW